MADIQTNSSHYSVKERTTRKKFSTRVDLTPMVDLGFLLIPFFIFTTTISYSTAMHLNLPDDNDPSFISTTPESKTISLLLAGDSKVYFYDGMNLAHMQQTDYSTKGLRAVILNKRKQVEQQFKDGKQTIVLIKPMAEASYKNVVDALDEMAINDIKTYVLMDASAQEMLTELNKLQQQ